MLIYPYKGSLIGFPGPPMSSSSSEFLGVEMHVSTDVKPFGMVQVGWDGESCRSPRRSASIRQDYPGATRDCSTHSSACAQ